MFWCVIRKLGIVGCVLGKRVFVNVDILMSFDFNILFEMDEFGK